MNKFNLTFSGEILAGHDPAQVRLRFAKKFAIDDPVRLERFFSGETITLRRNLERKSAAQLYHELHQIGVIAALVKITDSASDAATPSSSQRPPANTNGSVRKKAAASESGRPARSSASEQTWAVSSAAAKRKGKGRSGKSSAASPGASAPAVLKRDTADIAAGIRARKLETQQQSADRLARERAALAEQERSAAQATAVKQAQDLVRQRLAEEEAARLEAGRRRQAEEEAARRLEAERRRQAEEEAARQAAERRRKAEEEAAARQAAMAAEAARVAEEQARLRQREAEEEARRKAAEEASKREAERQRQQAERELRKAKAAAARQAQQAERKRRNAEEKARRQAAREERKRQEALEAARRKAELEEQKRRQAEAESRRQAALAEQQRLAEEAARQKAELEELQRREAEEEARLQAELAAIKLREAEEAERLRAELEEQARQAAAETARIREEAQRQQLEAQRKSALRRQAIAEALAARRARQSQKRLEASQPPAGPGIPPTRASRPAVQDLPLSIPDRRAKPRIRTGLEVPQRKSQQDAQTPVPEQRKRQPGEPNVYKLRPFRNTEEVRTRAAHAQQRARYSYTLGIVAVAALLMVAGGFLQRAVAPVIPGARAVAVDPRSGPMLLAHDALLFHDRAGIGTGVRPLSALGVNTLDPPLAFDDNGTLLAVGVRSSDGGAPSAGDAKQLLRCEAPLEQCAPFSAQLAENSIDAFAVNPVDGSLLLADRSVGLLLKTDSEGTIVARADVAFAEHPAMRLHSGLLLVNSATAPAISVLRYENNAFGQQLDEILLLPPDVEELDALRVGDFLWSGDAWWVSLHHPVAGHAGLFRFDEEWNFLDRVALPTGAGRRQLVNWDEKVLVNEPQQIAIERVSALGVVEAPFISSQLEAVSAQHQRRAWLAHLAWRGALLLCALGAALGLGFGYLQSRRALVYQPRREQGAEPLEEHVNALRWIDPVANRQTLLRRRMTSYAILALGVLLLAVARSVSVWQLAALLLALSGPAVALLLLSRRSIGHIGLLGDRLLLVDHNGTYHLAGGSRVQYRGPFLSIDDVVVYCGGRFLPAFSASQVQQLIRPLALGGIKVDRDTVSVKLLQSRHPLALGVLVIAAAITLALAVLSLPEIA